MQKRKLESKAWKNKLESKAEKRELESKAEIRILDFKAKLCYFDKNPSKFLDYKKPYYKVRQKNWLTRKRYLFPQKLEDLNANKVLPYKDIFDQTNERRECFFKPLKDHPNFKDIIKCQDDLYDIDVFLRMELKEMLPNNPITLTEEQIEDVLIKYSLALGHLKTAIESQSYQAKSGYKMIANKFYKLFFPKIHFRLPINLLDGSSIFPHDRLKDRHKKGRLHG